MASRVRRSTGVSSIYRDAVSYVRARADKVRAETPFKKSSTRVKKWLEEHGEVDADGNIFYHFPNPVADPDGKLWQGVHKRKTPGDPFFDLTEVIKYFEGTEWFDTVLPEVTRRVFNEEALYLLEQEGKIDKQVIRELLHDGEPKYSLWPIPYEGEVTDDD